MRISNKNLILYETEVFLTMSTGETRIEIDYEGDTLILILNFINDSSKKLELVYTKIEDETLKADLTNWNDPFGTTITEPITGTISDKNKTFYLQYSIRKIGNEGEVREVTVSLYIEKEGNDDNN